MPRIPNQTERRRQSAPPRIKLLDSTFGFLVHVGASPVSAFARTSTPHPRYRPKPDYHRAGSVSGNRNLALAYVAPTRRSTNNELDDLSFDELWRAAAPESVRFSPR
ncbi:MAG: hypothetical protein GF399_11425 [Candidatus Coatesbacteria bacterium]|nr:hypothetical protein [Candidatus Coatesbacteria bacterium]